MAFEHTFGEDRNLFDIYDSPYSKVLLYDNSVVTYVTT